MTLQAPEEFRVPISNRDTLQVRGSFSDQPQDFAVVYVHGFGASRLGEKSQALESACSRRDWNFVSFDFRGHGESSGTMLELTGTRLLEDLENLRLGLQPRGIRRLFPVGSSMGGWATCWYALANPSVIPACALIAPALDFIRARWKRMNEEERANWRNSGRLRVKNDWVDTEIGYCLVEEFERYPLEYLIPRWQTPSLIFHGMNDDIVPYTNSLEFVRQAIDGTTELRLYNRGDHRLVNWKNEMAEESCRFFARWI